MTLNNSRRGLAIGAAGFVTVTCAALLIAQSGVPSARTQQQQLGRGDSTVRERAGVLMIDCSFNGDTTGTNAIVDIANAIDVSTIHIENGRFSNGVSDRVGLTLELSGTMSYYFTTNGFESKTLQFDPPIPIRPGDRILADDVQDTFIQGFVQFTLHGRRPVNATGFQAK